MRRQSEKYMIKPKWKVKSEKYMIVVKAYDYRQSEKYMIIAHLKYKVNHAVGCNQHCTINGVIL